jgi:hypothetical protein
MRQAIRILVLATVVALIAGALFTTPALSTTRSTWYWAPAACKSELQNYGVRLGDGRTFNVAKAYCVGLHTHCWLSDGLRRYKVFIAVARSYDGVVRSFWLTVTGHNTWSGSHMRILQQDMSSSAFIAAYGPAAWTVAATENAAGCWDAHP